MRTEETEAIGGTNSDENRVEGYDCPVIVEEEDGYSEQKDNLYEKEIGEATWNFVEVPIVDGFDEEFAMEDDEDDEEGHDGSGSSEEIGRNRIRAKKIYFDNEDNEKGKINTDSISIAELEEMALKLITQS